MIGRYWIPDIWSRLGFLDVNHPSVGYCQRPDIVRKYSVVVTEFFAESLPEWQVRFSTSSDEIDDIRDSEVLIGPATPWFRDMINVLPRVKWVHLTGSGVDAMGKEWQPTTNVRFSTSAGVNANSIGDYVMGGILYFLKCFDVFRIQQENRVWTRRWLPELAGKNIVIVGAGKVGQAVARRAAAFGLTVTGVDKIAGAVDSFDFVVGLDQLDEVLATAAAVVLAVPLTSKTRALFNRLRFSKMPESCIFINVSRGEVVVEADLTDALARGKLQGAVLDVFENEPLPPSSPLWGLPNVLITPHVAGTTDRYMERMLDIFLANVRQLCESGALETPALFDGAD